MLLNTINKAVYAGNGEAVEFPITFVVHEKNDVKLLLVNPDGLEQLLERDYFIDLLAGKVLYPGYHPGQEPPEEERPKVLAEGWKLILCREAAPTQEVNFGSVWPFYVIEKAFDKVTMLVQQLMEKVGRSIVFPVSEEFDGQLPSPIVPGASLAVDETGKKLRYGANPDDAKNSMEYAKEAREVAFSIDGKAQAALDNSADAVETADEALALAEKLDEDIKGIALGDAKTLEGSGKEEIIRSAVERAADEAGEMIEAAVEAIDMSPYAPLDSPEFTGAPTAPTPTEGDNSTKIATTAFVSKNGGLTSIVTTTASKQAAISATVTAASGSGTVLTQIAGLAAGTRTMQQLLQNLVDLSHSHGTNAVGSVCNCACNCACECCD